jgi:hypothetical protein
MLESIEPRVAPSGVGLHIHHERVVAAHVGRVDNSIKFVEASERKNNEALKRLLHQLEMIHIRSLERTPSALPTKAQQVASKLSNLFKSIGQSL